MSESESGEPMVCVIVVPREGQDAVVAPAPLVDGLRARGMAVQVADSAPQAMVRVARGRSAAVVVVDPDRLADADELVRVVRCYHPQVVCWRFDRAEGQVGRLRAFAGGGDRMRRDPNAGRRPVEGLLHRVPGPGAGSSPLISEQELAMLLGGDGLEAPEAPEAGPPWRGAENPWRRVPGG